MKQHYAIAPHILDDLQVKYQNHLHDALTQMKDFIQTGDRSHTISQSL